VSLGIVEELKAIQRAARDATRAVRSLENETGGDVFGRFVIDEGEDFDAEVEREVLEFVRHARHMYPQNELSLILTARIPPDGR
jgi:hypothetical protein